MAVSIKGEAAINIERETKGVAKPLGRLAQSRVPRFNWRMQEKATLGIKPLGVLKDGARNLNRIVKGKYHDNVEWGIVGASQSLGELGSGCQLNFVR